MSRKFKLMKHDEYMAKAQYMADVMSSCVTYEQLSGACMWAETLIDGWMDFELTKNAFWFLRDTFTSIRGIIIQTKQRTLKKIDEKKYEYPGD